MIKINNEILEYFNSDKDKKIIELASFPENGATSSAMKLLSTIIGESELGMFLEREETARGAKYFNSFIDKEKQDNIIISSYKDTEDLKNMITFIPNLDYIVIDDFYSCIYYKRYTYIKDLMRFLKTKINESENLTIIFLNQYRHIINNEEYNFDDSESSIKTLYWEHLEEFVDARLESVRREDSNEIEVSLKSKKEKKNAVDSFLSFLESLTI